MNRGSVVLQNYTVSFTILTSSYIFFLPEIDSDFTATL